MLNLRSFAAVAAVASLIPLAAAAQTQGGGSTSPPTGGGGGGSFGGGGPQPPQLQFRQDLLTQAWMYHLTRLTGYRATKETELANRVSLLIDHGDCKGAESLARQEHNPSMAFKVPAVCDAKRRGLL